MNLSRKLCATVLLISVALVVMPALAPASHAAEVVVPNAYTSAEGDTWNRIPWSYYQELRFQQVYLGAEVGTGLITEVRFRQDVDYGQPFSHTLGSVVIVMATTSAAPDGLSTTFADNLGGDAVTVFSGDLLLSSGSSTAVPRPFDVIVHLSTPFDFDSRMGNLIIDVASPGGAPNTCGFDASYSNSVSRLFCVGAGCATSATASAPGDGIGLVTQFVLDCDIFADGFESGDFTAWSTTVGGS